MFRNNVLAFWAHVFVAWMLSLIAAGFTLAADPNGLVAYWALDGSAADAGPYSLDGTLIDGAGFADAILGDGLHLDGIDDYLDVTDASGAFPAVLGGLGQGTVSVWFKFDGLPDTRVIYPVFYMGDGVGGPGQSSVTIEIGHFDPGNTKLYWTSLRNDQQPVPTLCFDTGFNLQQGQWYHYAVVVDPTGNTGYLNGQELTDRHYNFADALSPEFLEDISVQEKVWIGRGFLGFDTRDHYFPGTIDELLIYDRPLSGVEISRYYQSTVTEPTVGDFNNDAIVNDQDIDLMRNAVISGSSDSQYNVDDWGDPDVPNEADFDFLISDIIGSGRGDGNLDQKINLDDFVILTNHYGRLNTNWSGGNYNIDSMTNFEDFVELTNRFGLTFPSAERRTPEPGTLVLVFCGLMASRRIGRLAMICGQDSSRKSRR